MLGFKGTVFFFFPLHCRLSASTHAFLCNFTPVLSQVELNKEVLEFEAREVTPMLLRAAVE
jgi:hypothetical protein